MSKGLRGIEAGITSICTVGETGDDLHYRGYDIVDLSEHCIFEEVCYLPVSYTHLTLPTTPYV